MNGNKLIIKLFSIFLMIFTTSCMYAIRYDGTYKGKVIDASTGEPIEGVVVLGIWNMAYAGAGGVIHKFYDARETVTDKNGEFEIPGGGLRILSNLEPMDVLIFKAGYEYIGMGPWESLKTAKLLSERIKWEGDKAIIPLRKLTMEERKKDPLYPPIPPTEAPLEKVKLILKEINKDLVKNGFKPMEIWRGEKIW